MPTILAFLLSLAEPFRFIKHSRERADYLAQWDLRVATERAEQALEKSRFEQAHQLTLAKTFMDGLTAMQEAQRDAQQTSVDGLMEIAKAISAQAESFGKWIALFQTSGPATSSVVRDEDELLKEQMALLEAGMPAELAELPEELRLAWALKNDPNWMDIGPNTV